MIGKRGVIAENRQRCDNSDGKADKHCGPFVLKHTDATFAAKRYKGCRRNPVMLRARDDVNAP